VELLAAAATAAQDQPGLLQGPKGAVSQEGQEASLVESMAVQQRGAGDLVARLPLGHRRQHQRPNEHLVELRMPEAVRMEQALGATEVEHLQELPVPRLPVLQQQREQLLEREERLRPWHEYAPAMQLYLHQLQRQHSQHSAAEQVHHPAAAQQPAHPSAAPHLPIKATLGGYSKADDHLDSKAAHAPIFDQQMDQQLHRRQTPAAARALPLRVGQEMNAAKCFLSKHDHVEQEQ